MDQRTAAPRAAGLRQGPPEQASPRELLVVDDEPVIIDLLRLVLEEQGYSVTTCGTVAAARAQLSTRRFDALLSDLALPDGDGLSLHRMLAAREDPLARRMILLTGDLRASELSRIEQVRTLAKPFDVTALCALVEQVIRAPQPAPAAR